MENELALQKLSEAREVLDGDAADMVDALARVVMLQQDIKDPMYGAKVTFWEKPEGEWVEVDYDHYRENVDGGLLPDDKEEAWEIYTDYDNVVFDHREHEPWWMQWRRLDGDNDKRVPDGEIRHVFKRYYAYGEKQTIHRNEVPDPLSTDNSLEEDCSIAEEMKESEEPSSEWFGGWSIYEADFREYRFTPFVEVSEFVPRRALVIEADIAGQPSDTEFWDPHKGEYTTPDDYPMGTVNVTLPKDPDETLGEDYIYDMRIETSVVPADDEPGAHEYTPGWQDI